MIRQTVSSVARTAMPDFVADQASSKAMLVLAGYRNRARSARWFWLALPMSVVARSIAGWAEVNPESLGDLAPHLAATWQPTSIPFLLRVSAAAIAVIAGLSWCILRAGLPRWLHPLACFGRASLTHYVGHIGLVYVALRIAWPAEDWPLAVGIAAALGYLAVALPLTVWWFRAFRRGPLEGALARCSGRPH